MPVIAAPAEPLLLDPLGGSTRTRETIAALMRWIGPALRRTQVHIIESGEEGLPPDRGRHAHRGSA